MKRYSSSSPLHRILRRSLFVIYILILLGLAAATWIEHEQGSRQASELIYHAPWFLGLWILLAIIGIYHLLHSRLLRRPAVMLLHIAFLLILAGAATTYATAEAGLLHLRPGEEKNMYRAGDKLQHYRPMPFSIRLDSFLMPLYSESNMPKDYVSCVSVRREGSERWIPKVISMNRILQVQDLRLYQSSYDEDLRGTWLSIYRDPYGIPLTYAGYILLLMGMCATLRARRTLLASGLRQYRMQYPGDRLLRLFLWSTVIFALCLGGRMIHKTYYTEVMPVLRSWLLPVHVTTIATGYFLLFCLFVLALLALLPWCRKNEARSLRFMQLSRILLYPALFLLTAGIFIGAVWANISWGRYWAWDPKETWALITLLVYAIPLHTRSLPALRRPKVYHRWMLLAFLCILMTYFGVNLLLGGLHSYA